MRPPSTPDNDQLSGELLERWMKLFPADTSAARVFGFLLLGYLSEDRHYHNLAHIAACLGELDAARPAAADARAVELAIFFHDAVYDPKMTNNEERSAEVAKLSLRQLGEDPARVEAVAGLVLATKHNAPPASGDEQLIVDIDLSIFGQPAETFDAYDRAIRLEYAHVPDEAFRTGRLAVLEKFLARDWIYGMGFFRDHYEAAARENLTRACERLRQEHS